MTRAARSVLPSPMGRPNKGRPFGANPRHAAREHHEHLVLQQFRAPEFPGPSGCIVARGAGETPTRPGVLGPRAARVRRWLRDGAARGVSRRVRGAGTRLMSMRAVRSACAGASEAAARLMRFGLVGASGFAVDVACYLALQGLGLDHRVARFVSFFPAASWNWLLNRKVTFGERAPDARARQWARFVTSSVAGAGVNAGSYAVLTSLTGFFDHHRMLALLLGVGLGGLVNFALATRYVYRRRVADPGTGPDRPPPGNRGGAAERRTDERERAPMWASKPTPFPAR